MVTPLTEKSNDVDPVMTFNCSRNDWKSYTSLFVQIDYKRIEGRKRNVASQFMDYKVGVIKM